MAWAAASWVRLVTPNFVNTCVRWVFTVVGLISSRSATCVVRVTCGDEGSDSLLGRGQARPAVVRPVAMTACPSGVLDGVIDAERPACGERVGVVGGELGDERVELFGVWGVALSIADGVVGCGARSEQAGGGHGSVAPVQELGDRLQRVDGEQGESCGVGVRDELVGCVEGFVVTFDLDRQQ